MPSTCKRFATLSGCLFTPSPLPPLSAASSWQLSCGQTQTQSHSPCPCCSPPSVSSAFTHTPMCPLPGCLFPSPLPHPSVNRLAAASASAAAKTNCSFWLCCNPKLLLLIISLLSRSLFLTLSLSLSRSPSLPVLQLQLECVLSADTMPEHAKDTFAKGKDTLLTLSQLHRLALYPTLSLDRQMSCAP